MERVNSYSPGARTGHHLWSFGCLCIQFKFVVFTSVNSFVAEMPCCCAPNCSSRTENDVQLFGFHTDGERTQKYINRKLAHCTTWFLTLWTVPSTTETTISDAPDPEFSDPDRSGYGPDPQTLVASPPKLVRKHVLCK